MFDGATGQLDSTALDSLNLPIWAQITDYDGSEFFSWVEQVPQSDGAGGVVFVDKDGGLTGEFDGYPAFEPNGCSVASGSVVQIVRAYYDPDLDWVFSIVYAPSCSGGASSGFQCFCFTNCNGAKKWFWFSTNPVQMFVSDVPCTPNPSFSLSFQSSGPSASQVCNLLSNLCLTWSSPPVTVDVSACQYCDNPAPTQYIVEVFFEDGISDNLSQFNGLLTFELSSNDNLSCVWDLVDISGLGLEPLDDGSSASIILNAVEGTVQVLFQNADPTSCYVIYQADLASFDCSSSNTVNLWQNAFGESIGLSCTDATVPDSIEVVPLGIGVGTVPNAPCTGFTSLTWNGNYWSGNGLLNGGVVNIQLYGNSLATLKLILNGTTYAVDPSSTCTFITWTITNGINSCAPITFTLVNAFCAGDGSSSSSLSYSFSSSQSSGSGACTLPVVICATMTSTGSGAPPQTCIECPPNSTPLTWAFSITANYFPTGGIFAQLVPLENVPVTLTQQSIGGGCSWTNLLTVGGLSPGSITFQIGTDFAGNASATLRITIAGRTLAWSYPFPGNAVNCSAPIPLTPGFTNPNGSTFANVTISPTGSITTGGSVSDCDACFSVMWNGNGLGGVWVGAGTFGGAYTVVTLTPGTYPTNYVMTAGGVSYLADSSSTCTSIVFKNVNIGSGTIRGAGAGGCQNATMTFDTTNSCCVYSSSFSGPSFSGSYPSSTSSSSISASVCGYGPQICGIYVGDSPITLCTACGINSAPAEVDFTAAFSGDNAGGIQSSWQLLYVQGSNCSWSAHTGTKTTESVYVILNLATNGSAQLIFNTVSVGGGGFQAIYSIDFFDCNGSNVFTLLSSTFDVAVDTLPSTITTTSISPANVCQGTFCLDNTSGCWSGYPEINGAAVQIQLCSAQTLDLWVLYIDGVTYLPDNTSACASLTFSNIVINGCVLSLIFSSSTGCCSVPSISSASVSISVGDVIVDVIDASSVSVLIPAGVTAVLVEAWGPGGNGNGKPGGGGGGGGGGYAMGVVPVTPGMTYTAVVGAPSISSSFTGDSAVIVQAGCGSNGLGAGGAYAGGDGGGTGSGGANIGDYVLIGSSGVTGNGTTLGGRGGAAANGGGSGGEGGTPSGVHGRDGLSVGGGGGAGGTAGDGGAGAAGRVRVAIV